MPRRLLALRRLVLMARVAVLVSLGLFVANVFAGRAGHDVMGKPIMGDFLAHYTGGHFAGTDALYSVDGQGAFESQVVGEPYLDLFISPPYVAYLYAPLARLPLPVAEWIWLGITLGSFALGWRLLRPHIGAPKRHERRLLVLFVLAFFPVVDLVGSGQDTCLTGLAWATAIHLVLSERALAAGLVLGLGAALKPQLFVLPVAYLFFTKRFRAVLGTMITSGACLLVSLATGGTNVFRAWLAILGSPAYVDATRRANIWKMQSIVATAEGLFPPSMSAVARPVGLAVAGVLFVLTLRRALALRDPRRAWSLLAVGSLLVSPHLFGYDLVLLVVPAVLLLGEKWQRSTVQAIVAIDIVLWFAVPRSIFAARDWPISILSVPLASLGMLVLWRDIGRGTSTA